MKIYEFLKKERKEILKSLFFSICIVLSFIFGGATAYIILNQENIEDLNDLFYLNSINFIQDKGASNIQEIVKQIDQTSSSEKRLNSIADVIVTNFTDPYWTDSSSNLFVDKCSSNIPFNHRFIGKNCNGFGFDKTGAIRARASNLSENPYWIAYYKTGACGELATLYANVSNQSGFVTRVVYSNDPNHAWTEIYLDGNWQYFDPDMYHTRQGNISYQDDWFNTPNSFEDITGWKFSKIVVDNSTPDGYEEDRTISYAKTGIVKIYLTKPVERIVVREVNHNSYAWTVKPNCSNYPCEFVENFGIDKKYVLQRYVSPGLFFDVERFSIEESEKVTIVIDSPIRLDKHWIRIPELLRSKMKENHFTN